MDKKLGLLVAMIVILALAKGTGLVYAGSTAEASVISIIPAETNLINPSINPTSNSVSLVKTIYVNPYENSLVNFEPASARGKNYLRLSEDEVREQKINSGLNWAKNTLQYIDGIPLIYQGTSELIAIGQGVNDFNKQVRKKYHLYLQADDSGAKAAYKIKF